MRMPLSPLNENWAETIIIGHKEPELVLKQPTQVECASFRKGRLYPLIHDGAEFHLWDGYPKGHLQVLKIIDKAFCLEYRPPKKPNMSRAHLQYELVRLLNRPVTEVETFLEDYFFAGRDYLLLYQEGLIWREELIMGMEERVWQIFAVEDQELLANIKILFADFVDGMEPQ